jgi:hypothetical protein
MIIVWFIALGSLKIPFAEHIFENAYTYQFQPYNSFRMKCNAINDLKKNGLEPATALNLELFFKMIEQVEKGIEEESKEQEENEESEGNEEEPPKIPLPKELEKVKELITKHKVSEWQQEDDYGYPYRECLHKELKDCTYSYYDIWAINIGMVILYVAGILSLIFNFPFIGKLLKRFPITGIVAMVAQTIGLLTYEPDLPFFAVFIVVIVSLYWGALANRYKSDCQSVIDAGEEWYDDVPTYAVGGGFSLMFVQFLIGERRKAQAREELRDRIQERKKKKEMDQAQKNKNFLSGGLFSGFVKLSGQKLNQNWDHQPIPKFSNRFKPKSLKSKSIIR